MGSVALQRYSILTCFGYAAGDIRRCCPTGFALERDNAACSRIYDLTMATTSKSGYPVDLADTLTFDCGYTAATLAEIYQRRYASIVIQKAMAVRTTCFRQGNDPMAGL